MSKTNLLVDTGIFVAMLVAMEPNFSGVAIHEWLSLALAAVIIFHLLLHWKWIVKVGAQFFKKLWHVSRLKLVVDSLLFVDFVAVMLSGIMISRVALPALGVSLGQTDMAWRSFHSLTADSCILLVGLHFALSWNWVVSTIKRIVIAPIKLLFHPRQVAQPMVVSNEEPYQK